MESLKSFINLVVTVMLAKITLAVIQSLALAE